jgi:hypothetical protein
MKISYLIFLIGFIITTNTSCNKGDEPTPEIIDSVKSILPKQIIFYQISDEPDSLRLSLKYDTVNRKVELYEDDPATPDLYDKLAMRSTFNDDGYLVKFEMNSDKFLDASFYDATININRASNNEINYIAYDDRDINQKDTSIYTYKPVGDGTEITTSGYQSYFEGTVSYKYDKDNKLLSYQFQPNTTYGIAQFYYNTNNSISKVEKTGGDYDNVAEFSYTSGIPDDKEDVLGRVLFGKDYYLWDLKDMNPFIFYLDADYDDYPISFTDPYHITRMQDTHKPDADPDGIEGVNISYELNENKLVSKVTIKYDDYDVPGIILFKY